ncbi:MAG: TlpA family protein disulfide reductase [Oscillospiraceae bacterium]|nr:TlpA family protein disulfide reductase [Oscillospiraceae bacterium]
MNKKVLLILIVTLVLVIGGAYFFYQQFAPGFAPEQLATFAPTTEPPTTEPSTEESTEASTEASTEVPTEATTEAPDLSAPDFTVYDAQGNEVKLSDYFGKPIVLNFWASWCGPCKMEMPYFEEVYQQIADRVQFLMVNSTDGSSETVETASAFIAEQGYTFPVFYDTSFEASINYQAFSLPTTYFISAEGELIAKATGSIDKDTLLYGIGMIAEIQESQ